VLRGAILSAALLSACAQTGKPTEEARQDKLKEAAEALGGAIAAARTCGVPVEQMQGASRAFAAMLEFQRVMVKAVSLRPDLRQEFGWADHADLRSSLRAGAMRATSGGQLSPTGCARLTADWPDSDRAFAGVAQNLESLMQDEKIKLLVTHIASEDSVMADFAPDGQNFRIQFPSDASARVKVDQLTAGVAVPESSIWLSELDGLSYMVSEARSNDAAADHGSPDDAVAGFLDARKSTEPVEILERKSVVWKSPLGAPASGVRLTVRDQEGHVIEAIFLATQGELFTAVVFDLTAHARRDAMDAYIDSLAVLR
jgi:hypothetical protein